MRGYRPLLQKGADELTSPSAFLHVAVAVAVNAHVNAHVNAA